MKRIFLSLFLIPFFPSLWAQFSSQDSLRGALSPLRDCYDVHYYDLSVKVDILSQGISGSNSIHFHAVHDFDRLQIDLFENLGIDKILFENQLLTFTREGNALFVSFPRTVKTGELGVIHISYGGRPRRAVNPPWDGGFVWSSDESGKPWVGVACEGLGASSWWPLKDHLSDEPDSMRITVIAPDSLMAVANGQFRGKKSTGSGYSASEWFVSYPINSYNVTLNIADYVHWQEKYENPSGLHDLDYYVLRANETKARAQFKQVGPMLKCFEKFFGEYPFWRDGYALVETPYLGMEHQGAIAYGNEYMPGYQGFDALNLGWDYIIIHESGHEWWGNSISAKDHAELWIHESFCTYSEAVYVECMFGKNTAENYLMTQRSNILNKTPLVGPLDVNYQDWVGSDIYYKGAWMLHTLRWATQNDEQWWGALKAFAEENQLTTLHTEDVISFFNNKIGKDFSPIWKQYLYHATPPTLQLKTKKSGKGSWVEAKWEAGEPNFSLPVYFIDGKGNETQIVVGPQWTKTKVNIPFKELKLITSRFYGKVEFL